MKKFFGIILISLCAAVLCMPLTACSDPGAPDHDTSDAKFAISVETLENTLEEFLSDGREDRTTGTVAEADAAAYIADKLVSYGYSVGDVKTIDFTLARRNASELHSQHVTAVYRSENSDASNVIIGAYYDNGYATLNEVSYGEKISYNHSNGALSNGTGVSTLLALAEYFIKNSPKLDFDVTFAFFGASSTSTSGAVKFIDALGDEGMSNTVCMIELDRIGVDNVYAFADARKTKREELFDRVAQENKLDIYKVTQKSPQITGVSALNGIPYYQWVMGGVYSTFFNHGIPTLGIMGANWETIDMTDTESASHENISFTSEDTLDKLKLLHPNYGSKMAAAATLVVESLTDDEFLSTVRYDRANFPDTSVLDKTWIWELIVIGVLLLAAAGMVAVISHLGKKYKMQPPKPPRNIKMAVFGMDYEDKSSDNIYIDIKEAGSDPFDDIFPGVPNNDKDPKKSQSNGNNDNDPFSDYPDHPSDNK